MSIPKFADSKNKYREILGIDIWNRAKLNSTYSVWMSSLPVSACFSGFPLQSKNMHHGCLETLTCI